MSVTSILKKQVDLPVWEWCRFAPFASAGGWTLCSDESLGGRYIYYIGSTCYRYDTITDGWQQIATPLSPMNNAQGATRYTVFGGYRGRVLSGTSTTIQIPSLQGTKLVGKKIRITSGTGVGQERTITAITEPTIYEHGIANAVTNTNPPVSITDNQAAPGFPKKWKINQWAGYQCRMVFGSATGLSQVRKILYNDTNTLYFSDTNWQPYDPWNAHAFFNANLPYAVPVANQTMYYIESSVATVAAWTTVPDSSSKFVVISGGIWFATYTSPGILWQYYDVISDTWVRKTQPNWIMPVAFTGDLTVERTGEIGGVFTSGQCSTTGDARSFINSGATWEIDRYSNYQVRMVNPATGIEQRRRILGNKTTQMWVDKPWDAIPDSTYTYAIYGDTNAIWVAGNGQSSIYKYMVEEDLWAQGQNYDSGVVSNMCVGKPGKLPFSITTYTVNTASILVINPVPTAPGLGYKVGDIVNVANAAAGYTGAKVRVTSIVSTTGAVNTIELYACGTGGTYATGTGKATTLGIPGGTSGGNNGLTVEITSVGNVARITTSINHDFVMGDIIWLSGATVSAWNTGYTILACDAISAFDIIAPNSTPPVPLYTNSTSIVVDPSKNWTVNEHSGKTFTLTTVGYSAPTFQMRKISGNTATALFFTALSSQGVIGTSRYLISDQAFFGKDEQYKMIGQGGDGWATTGTSITLEDSTKTWIPGQWIGYKMRVICGTGFDKGEIFISDNTISGLTLTTPGFSPDATTKYKIMYSYGLMTSGSAGSIVDTTKRWDVNMWVGKSIRFVSSTANVYESVISANTVTGITYSPANAIDTTSGIYTILAPQPRLQGIQFMWNYGQSNTSLKGKYLYVPRGSASYSPSVATNTIDRYNITTDLWDVALLLNPAFESVWYFAQWAYDGKDRLYWTPTYTKTTLFSIDLNTLTVDAASIHPYAQSTSSVQGNRMEIITTEDGLQYLYLLRVNGTELWRTLLWW